MNRTACSLVAALLVSCGTKGEAPPGEPADTGPPPLGCSATTLPRDGACVAVGVDDCGAGFVADGEGGCKPVLPSGCTDLELAVLGQTACQRVGVTACAKGFREDGAGGCEPVLPATPCAAGTFAIPGEVACHEPSACTGADPWGELPDDPSALYVDAAYTGTSDGTRARPFVTLAAAIAASSATAPNKIVLAAGTYDGTFTGGKELELRGRCARRTIVTGEIVSSKALTFASITKRDGRAGTNTRMRVIDSIVGEQSSVNGFTEVEIRGSLFEGTSLRGAHIGGKLATIERSAFRGVRASATGDAAALQFVGKGGTMKIADTLIEDSAGLGVRVEAGTTTIVRTVIRGTQKTARWPGTALYALNAETRVTIEDSTLTGSGHAAVNAGAGASIALLRTTIRDVAAGTDGAVTGAFGVRLTCFDACGSLEVRESVIGRGLGTAIESAAPTTITRSILGPTLAGAQGYGLRVEPESATLPDARTSVTSTLALRNAAAGFEVSKTTLELTDCESRSGDNPDCVFGDTCGAGLGSTGASTGALPTLLTVNGFVVSGGRRGAYLNWTKLARLDRVFVTGAKEIGLYAYASELDVSHAVVFGAGATAPEYGGGVAAVSAGTPFFDRVVRSKLTARATTIVGTAVAGFAVLGSDATIERCAVRNVRARADGKFGDGIGVMHYPVEDAPAISAATVRASLITGNARVGVSTFGGALALEGSRASCNAFALNAQSLTIAGKPQPFALDDRGGNACGCGAPERCRLDGADLEPIDPTSFVTP